MYNKKEIVKKSIIFYSFFITISIQNSRKTKRVVASQQSHIPIVKIYLISSRNTKILFV